MYFIRINLVAHFYTWIHTLSQTPWRIDKQTPGTDDCSLNKQTLLCVLHPTRPHPFPTVATNPSSTVQRCTQTVKSQLLHEMNHSHISTSGWTSEDSLGDSYSSAVSIFLTLSLHGVSLSADCSGSPLVRCQRFLAVWRQTEWRNKDSLSLDTQYVWQKKYTGS